MFKRKINILLFTIVLVLWSMILFKFIKPFFFIEKHFTEAQNKSMNFETLKISKDTFQLENLSRDPFIDVKFQDKNPIIKEKKVNSSIVQKRKITEEKSFEFPVIIYNGYLMNEKNQTYALVKINYKKKRMLINEEFEGVKLVKIYKDSVKFKFRNENKIIYLEK